MNIDVLISTMEQKDYSLLEKMNISSDCVVVNQCGSDSIVEFEFRGCNVKWINSSEKGLSRSRNLAIRNSTADICLIADDDLLYVDGFADKVLVEFERNKDAAIIAFVVEGVGRIFKSYPKTKKKLNFFSAMKVSSVQISFDRKKLLDKGVSFKEEFGAGSLFYAGEESILLSDCLRKNMTAYFVPVKIAYLYFGESSWFKGFDESYFVTKGAVFTAMSKSLSIPLVVQFAIRKRRLYHKEFSTAKALRYMLKGRVKYLRRVKDGL